MNPLFVAHLLGDYLLQPGWLVRLKENRVAGISIHAGVHFVAMALLVWSNDIRVWAGLIVIASTHALVDMTKVHLQKNAKSFGIGFLMDQIMHVSIMAGVSMLIPLKLGFWATHDGVVLASLLIFVSYGLALYNLTHITKFPTETMGKKVVRMLEVTVAFAFFILPAALIASSYCAV